MNESNSTLEDWNEGNDYEEDFEVESRPATRTSRRCLTPNISTPSRPQSGNNTSIERLYSPSRPEGPMPSSRKSFRDYK